MKSVSWMVIPVLISLPVGGALADCYSDCREEGNDYYYKWIELTCSRDMEPEEWNRCKDGIREQAYQIQQRCIRQRCEAEGPLRLTETLYGRSPKITQACQ